jgi:hypothetical protein
MVAAFAAPLYSRRLISLIRDSYPRRPNGSVQSEVVVQRAPSSDICRVIDALQRAGMEAHLVDSPEQLVREYELLDALRQPVLRPSGREDRRN